MRYLEYVTFPDAECEFEFFNALKRTVYDSFYPFQVLSKHHLERLDFEDITILYGGNGSGKTTALNVIADMCEVQRGANYNKSNFFEEYVQMCDAGGSVSVPSHSRILTSDDVFDHLLDVRSLNDGVDQKREALFEDYQHIKHTPFQLSSLEDYEQLKRMNKARSKTQSRFVRSELASNIRTQSNGESAFRYFTHKIEENGLYILDEPENSLSPERQLELVSFIEDSARYFGCQFILSTHSPFMLAMKDAKIYDMDANPVDTKKWTDLENVRVYQQFFEQHQHAFR